MSRISIGLLLAVLASAGCSQMPLEDWSRVLLPARGLREETIAQGLSEALRVGTQRAARARARVGGFGDDPVLRLRLPESLQPAAGVLRTMGLGAQVDEVERGMNRAAERAAGEAVGVFAEAIAGMTLVDVLDIWRGAPDAATRYFEARTSDALARRMQPVVQDAMTQVGLYTIYSEFVRRYESLPVSKPAAPDLTGLITERTLAGLFQSLAAEERAIREDPIARSTDLLRRVFGELDRERAGSTQTGR